MIRILHIVTALDGGGVEKMLLNYYSNMDSEKFKFDFITYTENGHLEKCFEELGSKIFHIPPIRKSPVENLYIVNQIISNGNYDVVHSHVGASSFLPMYLSKRNKVKMRITHNHLAYRKENIFRKIIISILIFIIKKNTTDWFACSKDAAISFWGKRSLNKHKVKIIKNAIELENFVFNKVIRKKVRKELGIEDKFVIGNVARFDYQKNHEFLIKIFYEIHKMNKESVLLLVGSGELEDDIKKQVRHLGLSEAVKFLGVRSDVNNLMQAMDIFLLPSRFEGLGIVYIEAQTSGLISFGSDIVVPREAKVTDLMYFMSLDETPKYWANHIMKYKDGYKRKSKADHIKNAGFDIKIESKYLEGLYEKGTYMIN